MCVMWVEFSSATEKFDWESAGFFGAEHRNSQRKVLVFLFFGIANCDCKSSFIRLCTKPIKACMYIEKVYIAFAI